MYLDSTGANWLTPDVELDDESKFRAEYYAAKDAEKRSKRTVIKATSPTTQEPIIRAGILARFGRFIPLM